MNITETLNSLDASSSQRSNTLTRQEGLEVLRAIVRGVRIKDVDRALGLPQGTIYTKMGTWVMRHPDLVLGEEEG